jgi:hypothetical protein
MSLDPFQSSMLVSAWALPVSKKARGEGRYHSDMAGDLKDIIGIK